MKKIYAALILSMFMGCQVNCDGPIHTVCRDDCRGKCELSCVNKQAVYSCELQGCYCECLEIDAGSSSNNTDASTTDADYYCIHYLNGDC